MIEWNSCLNWKKLFMTACSLDGIQQIWKQIMIMIGEYCEMQI